MNQIKARKISTICQKRIEVITPAFFRPASAPSSVFRHPLHDPPHPSIRVHSGHMSRPTYLGSNVKHIETTELENRRQKIPHKSNNFDFEIHSPFTAKD